MTSALLPPDAWPAAVQSLVEVRARNEPLSSKVVAYVAELCGKSTRTMWRWIKQGGVPTRHRPSYELNDTELAEYARWRGNAAAVHRALYQHRQGGPTLRTLQRAFRSLTPAEIAMVLHGNAARRQMEVNIKMEYTRRNELWVADHSQLDCLVLPTRATRPQRPWSTIFIDASTRLITGWALSLQPTHATVLSALRRAVLPKQDPTQSVICGRPDMLQTDNGLEFIADKVASAVLLMGGQARTIRAYSPHLDGPVERLHRTMDTTWLAGEPFYTGAARTHDGQRVRPKNCLPITFDEFVEKFAEWVRFYNCERPHRALHGQTPLEAWMADPSPLVIPNESTLDWMLDVPVIRKVGAYGIELGGLHYGHRDLNGYRGRNVEVRTPVNETHFVDVYVEGRKICRATPQANWSEDERQDFMNARRVNRRRQNKARHDALAAQAVELNERRALTDASREQTSRDANTATDGNLHRSSDTSLLPLDTDDEPQEFAA